MSWSESCAGICLHEPLRNLDTRVACVLETLPLKEVLGMRRRRTV